MIPLNLDPKYRAYGARIARAVHHEHRHLLSDVKPLVDEQPGLLSRDLPRSQVEGLLNAVAAGPDLSRPTERLLALAEYLARSQARSRPGQRWHGLAEQLRDHIADLEARAEHILNEADHGDAPPDDVRATLKLALHVYLVEAFLDLLVGYYAARRQETGEDTTPGTGI